MISCDTNVLFAATNPDDACHAAAYDFVACHAEDANFVLAEQVLIELYGLLRNPAVLKRPLSASEAVSVIRAYRGNPVWSVVDVPQDGRVMREVWQRAACPSFARRRIHDLRLAFTLRYSGVSEFYTRNVKDFVDVGFAKLENPLGDGNV